MKIDKLLMSCRKNIFPENRIKRNKLFSTLSIVKLENDNYELTEEEKRNILHIYACDNSLSDEEIKEICQIRALSYFPLFCKSYASYGKNFQEGEAFFKEPIEVFEEEIRYFRQNDQKQILCFSSSWFFLTIIFELVI